MHIPSILPADPRFVPDVLARSVLVVDDEHAIRHLIARVLRRHDYTAEEAPDGRAALERVTGKVFHSIVLDLMMPFVTGFEVLRRLSERDQWRDAVVVVSAIADVDRQGLLALPCVHAVLSKPFDVRELVSHVGACRGAA